MTPPIEDIKVTPENAKDLTDEEIDIVVTEKQTRLSANLSDSKEKKESKETVTKSLEFEEDTFKIDSTWWDVIERKGWGYSGKSEMFKVKISPDRDVYEFLEWPQKWEQIFCYYKSFIKYVAADKKCTVEQAEDKYLLSKYEFLHILNMRERREKISEYDQTREFVSNNLEQHMAGYFDNREKRFYSVGSRASFWLIDEGCALNRNWEVHRLEKNRIGCSGRLLKRKF